MTLFEMLKVDWQGCYVGMAVEARLDGPHGCAVPCQLHEHQVDATGEVSAVVVDDDGKAYECDGRLVDLVELDGFWTD